MAVIVTFNVPGVGPELYEACVERLTGGQGFTSPADLPVPGLLSHATGPVDGGWRVTDVWESVEAFEEFGKLLGPIITDLGYGDLRPEVTPAHKVVTR
ncbi:hypothetical protein [Streptomyces albireticuli]|uniref:ABM domain-containing protein n=1 Tax=Streptomyces albireticuli TaxID=1940 RepID=A0A2A2DG87_9ACTN|nr:hypothetical protein [Streptomyces albireticuli]MCD9141007.1 hypothetical protein [Streptomyces albireticuli]MCD9161031.1 hypothetical protein [Streptomyces albireticuli]MCD9190911.1 hypothetical protein [Streptomyces albireticuli]PAU50535.1 hypothetical protein CK936_02110 [Streptomyces albireticuli]